MDTNKAINKVPKHKIIVLFVYSNKIELFMLDRVVESNKTLIAKKNMPIIGRKITTEINKSENL